MSDNSIYASQIFSKFLSSFRTWLDSRSFLQSSITSVFTPNSSNIHVSLWDFDYHLFHVHFVFVGSDLFSVESPGLSYFIRIKSWEALPFVKFLWRNYSEQVNQFLFILWIGTFSFDLYFPIFEDENFLFRGKKL